jgi:hypothetical protein
MTIGNALAVIAAAACAACTRGKPAPDSMSANPAGVDAHVGKMQSSLPESPSAVPPAAPTSHGPSPFAVALEAPSNIGMSQTTGRRFVMDGFSFVRVDADGFRPDESMVAGLAGCNEWLDGLAGRWPDTVFVSKAWSNGNVGFQEVYRRTGKQWSRVAGKTERSAIGGTTLGPMGPWMNGTTLLMVTTEGPVHVGKTEYLETRANDIRFRVLGGVAPTPQSERLPHTDDFACKVKVIPDRVVSLPTGDLFALGPACDRDAAKLQFVERWSKGASKSVVEPLPGGPIRGTWALAAGAADDVYAIRFAESFGPPLHSDYLAHFDGTRWEAQPPAPADSQGAPSRDLTSHPTVAAVTAQGDLLVISGGVWRRARGGPWEMIPLPDPPEDAAAGASLQPYGVWADDPFVWVAAGYEMPRPAAAGANAPVEYRHVLLRTGWSHPPFHHRMLEPCALLPT